MLSWPSDSRRTSVQRCAGCHRVVLSEQPEILKVLEYWENEEPIPWVRVHDLPDYVLVRPREGRAVKVEGNPEHPVNRGGLCVRDQASLQGLYNPDRITGPHRRRVTNADAGQSVLDPAAWDEAQQELVDRLQALYEAGRGERVALITPPLTGTLAALVSSWSAALGARWIRYEPFGYEAIRAANDRIFGRAEVPHYDFARGRDGDFVRGRFSGDVQLSGRVRPRPRGTAPRPERRHDAVRADRTGALADRGQRRRLACHRSPDRRAGGGGHGAGHRDRAAGAGRAGGRGGPHRRAGRRPDARRRERGHRPVRRPNSRAGARVLGSGARSRPDPGRGRGWGCPGPTPPLRTSRSRC